jgi:hypothetical protein
MLYGGIVQDRIATTMLGRSARKKDMISFSLKIDANMEKVRDILLTDKFRKNLNLGKKIESDNGSLTIRSPKKGRYTTILRLEKGSTPDETILNEVFFQIKDYYITLPEDLEEYARSRFVYLREILKEDYNFESRKLPVASANHLIDSVLGEMQGWSFYTEKLSKMDWFKIGAFVSALVFAAYLFMLRDFVSAIATLILVLLYLAFELPSRLRHKGD